MYTVRFSSELGGSFAPLVSISPKSAYDLNSTIATLQIGEFSIPLTRNMAEQLHTDVGTILSGILYPHPDLNA